MKVSGLGHFPLGTQVPNKEHAVCVSLPSFEDVVGYEEKRPETLKNLKSGYPRFVRHQKINHLADYWNKRTPYIGTDSFFFTSAKDWKFAENILQIDGAVTEEKEGYLMAYVPEGSRESVKINKFLQHSGCGLSSRQAETILESLGLVETSETVSPNADAEDQIKAVISKAHGPKVDAEDVLLSSSGANAFTSVFRAALEQSRQERKKLWIRLGWLYLDTIEIMNLLTRSEEQIIDLNHPDEFENLEGIFASNGIQIAGVVTEFPSNPLLHSCNLEKVRQLCDRHNSLLIVDPTMASPKNAQVTNLADIVINSLTKYANWEGDVMMGSAVFPKSSVKGMAIKETAINLITAPFSKDAERMAEQIPFYDNFIDRTNNTQLEIVEFLNSHAKVSSVYSAYQELTGNNYRKLAGEGKPGCVVSFEVNGSFRDFYDELSMLKSPSFGTEFSLCCPYVYLAHYDMINSVQGKKKLQQAKLPHELVRLSVGLEEPTSIMEVLGRALGKC